MEGDNMNDKEYRAFLNLMMRSDPWPVSDEDQITLEALADKESANRGFKEWITAYHEF